MALFSIDPAAIAQTAVTTAAGRIAQKIAQSATPNIVRDVQRVLNTGSLIGQAVGLNTGIGLIDNLIGGIQRDTPTPLLGGLSLRQAEAIYERASELRLARKNLFFVRITDENPPVAVVQQRPPTGISGLIQSRIGPAAASLAAGISRSLNAVNGSLGGLTSVSDLALSTFDLLCMEVSYSDSLTADHTQIGSSFIDAPTGSSPTTMQITSMDDEAGVIKKWFQAKMDQVALPDGTFGLPAQYLVTIEVVHAVPLGGGDQALAYSGKMRMRAEQMQFDLSRRDQGLQEIQLTFSQFDQFMGT